MKTIVTTDGLTTWFGFTEVEPAYGEAVRHLAYPPTAEGFAKQFLADTPGLDRIGRHFARSAGAMVRQAAGLEPAPWEDTLETFLALVRGETLNWLLVGSAALAVRGIAVHPGDIDLVTDDSGAERLQELLSDHCVEPLQRSQGWIWNSFGRAFFSGRLEWVGGVNDGADRPAVSDFGPAAVARLEVVTWRGVEIKVPPLDLQLAVSERRGMKERAEMIRRHMLAGLEGKE